MFLGILWKLSLQNKPNWNDNMPTEIKSKNQISKDQEFEEITFDNF